MSHRHAVVLGASIAGILAARVLAETYATVTVLDRDALPVAPVDRKGVPQGNHLHGMLARGREILEDLFPGLTADLTARGAHAIDLQRDCVWRLDGRQLPRVESGLVALGISRAALEHDLRRRTAALGNVVFRDRHEVVGLVGKGNGNGGGDVVGVRVRPDGGVEWQMAADLVVDATGRGNRAATWLAGLGLPVPDEERIDPGTVYVSRTYRRTPGAVDYLGSFLGPSPARPYGGNLIAIDGNRWMVVLLGVGPGQAPPTDPEGYERFAAKLSGPEIHAIVRDEEALDDARRMRLPTSARRRYERMHTLPGNFLATGDALCTFNPAYGQGMAIAAIEAAILRECLRQGTAELPRRFFGRAARAIDVPWDMAVGGDLRYDHVEGPRSAKNDRINAFLARVSTAAPRDAAVARVFLGVANLVQRPTRLFAPDMLARVLWHSRQPRERRKVDAMARGHA